jgi:hypothetical protein
MWELASVRISERLLTVLVLCLLVAAIPAHAGGKGERELKQAQALFDEKRFSKAMALIVDIMKEYPDLREETDKLVARIMDVRRQVNEKVTDLLDAKAQNEVERGFAIIEDLKRLDPYPDPAVSALIEAARWALTWAGEFQRFDAVMKAAAAQLADAKYAEAIATYLGGFGISREYFEAAAYSEISKAGARAAVAELESASRQAAASEAGVRAVTGSLGALLAAPVTESGRAGFVGKLQPLVQAREREAQIRTLAGRLQQINAAIDEANGDKEQSDPWIYIVEQFALGRANVAPEGIAFAARLPWTQTARSLSDAATASADEASARTDTAFSGTIDLPAFRIQAADAQSRALLAQSILDVEATAWVPSDYLTLSEEEASRARKVAELRGRMERHVRDADAMAAFAELEAAAERRIADLDRRLQSIPTPSIVDQKILAQGRTDLGTVRNDAAAGIAEWNARVGTTVDGSLMAGRAAGVRNRFGGIASRALAADTALATRIAGLEAAGFEQRKDDAEARLERGRTLAAGTAGGGTLTGRWPDLAIAEYLPALSDIGALLSAVDAWKNKWTSEPDLVSKSEAILGMLAANNELSLKVIALQATIAAARTDAQKAVDRATQLRGQAESAYQDGQTKVKQKNYIDAQKSYTTARDSFRDSLDLQESSVARSRLEELQRLILAVEAGAREQKLTTAQALIDKGTRQYIDKEYEAAIATLEEARKLWDAEAGSDNTTITIYIERATAALKVTGKQEITRLDPIYEDIRGFMTQAELSYNRAESLQKASSRTAEYRGAVAAARSSVQAITAVVPEYREARLLALKIDRLESGAAEFERELRAREDASIRDANNDRAGEITWRDAYYSLNAYTVYEKDARRLKLISDTISSLEVKLGLRDAPISDAKKRESIAFYQAANTEYRKGTNDSFRWEAALWSLQKSLDANPLNRDAQALRNQIAVKRKTLVDVLSEDELKSARAANQDIINRNTLRAEATIDELLRAKPRNPLLLDLKGKIAR